MQQLSMFIDNTANCHKAIIDINALFDKEYRCLTELHHPNIVRIIDRGVYAPDQKELTEEYRFIDSLNFIVMDYIHRSSLDVFLSNNDPDKETAVYILSKICEALSYLHNTKEYLHMDIRSSNIRIREGTIEPIIIDFALYKNFNFSEVNEEDITNLDDDWDLFPKEFDDDDLLKEVKERQKGLPKKP